MYKHCLKRMIDICLSAAGLFILALPMAIIAVIVKLDSKGPVIFYQKRVGMRRTTFLMPKFRTMYTEAPADIPTHLLDDPARWITRSGKFLRAASLDELPQIWCILKGDMSVIGPRPALWNQYDLIAEREQYGANDVRPGLTGWAQINGRDKLSVNEKAAYDGEYVRRMSFAFDCMCFIRTISCVLREKGVAEGGAGAAEKRTKAARGI